jgi:hypothetical protein
MMNTEPSQKPNPKLRWYQPKICTDQNGIHGNRTRDLFTGATGALSIELVPLFRRASFPGFDTYTGPIGGVLFRSTTVMDTACTSASVFSEREYRRYCRDVGVEYNILPNSSAWVSFGDANKVTGQGRIRSLGIAIIKGYLPDLDTVLNSTPTSCPVLIPLF